MIYCSNCKHFAICYKVKEVKDKGLNAQCKRCVHYNAADKENPIVTFAEKLKEQAFDDLKYDPILTRYVVSVDDIERIVKEMTEGKNNVQVTD